jgi:fibronectin type 3 domain-containing protein
MGVASYYRIVAVDLSGTESSPASITHTRGGGGGADVTPPAAPTGLVLAPSVGGILLDWADNAEGDLAGYQVWRTNSVGGTWTKLNDVLLTTSAFNDTTAPAGQVSYYAVFALDGSGNASAATNGQATRPNDVSAPAAPSGLTASAKNSGIALDWANNVESDLAGYDVYRATSAGGTYVKINTSLLTSSAYFDAAAPRGVTSFYRVVALNTGGAASSPASISMARPAQAPFKGNPFAIGATPITIQAEDFDLGGQGIAYNDTTTSNIGGQYRAGEAVDIKTIAGTTGQYRISDAINGEWLEYTTEVAASGTYLMEFRVGSRDPGAKFHLELNGVNVSGILTVPDTDSFDVFTTVSLPLQLAAGEQVLRFVFDAPGTSGYGAAFDWMKVTQQNVSGPVAPAAPAGLTGTGTQGGNQLQWNDNTEADLAGYYVERSSSAGGTYTRISGASLITASEYLDTTAPAGATSYYRVVAVSTASLESTPATTNATRPTAADTTAPAAPTNPTAVGNTAGIALNWADNTEGDFAGYRLYRSDTLNGTYTLVNTGGLLTASAYDDTSMPAGATRFYKLTAVDTTGNESAQSASFSGTRSDGVSGTVSLGAIADATVRGGTSASINYGQAATLEIKGGGDINLNRRAFLKFDLSGITSVTNAVVRLFGYLADSTKATAVNLHAVSNDSWTESGITYNNAPALGSVVATNTVTGANVGAAAWYEFDVTAYLQAAIAAGKTEVTLAVATTASVRVAFNSAEATANQPALVVTT